MPRALELERRMREEGLEPNVITLTSLMQARTRLHLGGASRAYPSGIEHAFRASQVIGRAGDLDHAMSVLNAQLALGIEADTTAWRPLIHMAARNGEVRAQRQRRGSSATTITGTTATNSHLHHNSSHLHHNSSHHHHNSSHHHHNSSHHHHHNSRHHHNNNNVACHV